MAPTQSKPKRRARTAEPARTARRSGTFAKDCDEETARPATSRYPRDAIGSCASPKSVKPRAHAIGPGKGWGQAAVANAQACSQRSPTRADGDPSSIAPVAMLMTFVFTPLVPLFRAPFPGVFMDNYARFRRILTHFAHMPTYVSTTDDGCRRSRRSCGERRSANHNCCQRRTKKPHVLSPMIVPMLSNATAR